MARLESTEPSVTIYDADNQRWNKFLFNKRVNTKGLITISLTKIISEDRSLIYFLTQSLDTPPLIYR